MTPATPIRFINTMAAILGQHGLIHGATCPPACTTDHVASMGADQMRDCLRAIRTTWMLDGSQAYANEKRGHARTLLIDEIHRPRLYNAALAAYQKRERELKRMIGKSQARPAEVAMELAGLRMILDALKRRDTMPADQATG